MIELIENPGHTWPLVRLHLSDGSTRLYAPSDPDRGRPPKPGDTFAAAEAMVRPDPAAAPAALNLARRNRAGELVDSNVYNSRYD